MFFAIALALLMQAAPGTENAPTPAPTGAPYDSALEARVKEVSSVLRCPVCQGLSIQDSPSELSLQMKDVVRQQLREGKSPDEVKAYFVSKYGEWILLEPKASGMNLIVYALPVVLVILGAGFVWMLVRRWSNAAPLSTQPAPDEEETPV
jgi:cytochrome c-type biogenesis protein CcmH